LIHHHRFDAELLTTGTTITGLTITGLTMTGLMTTGLTTSVLTNPPLDVDLAVQPLLCVPVAVEQSRSNTTEAAPSPPSVYPNADSWRGAIEFLHSSLG